MCCTQCKPSGDGSTAVALLKVLVTVLLLRNVCGTVSTATVLKASELQGSSLQKCSEFSLLLALLAATM